MILGLLKMPETSVFSRVCGLLVKMQRYRILSGNGVVLGKNGVVERMWNWDGDIECRNMK